jgi:isoleucyl-tRNA synthetase
VAFKNVISSGLVLDAKGNKMSKHVGNVVNPFDMIEKYGSDAVRLYMMTNSEPWDNLKFDPEGVDEIRRKFFGTLYNTYSFFALYANVDGFNPDQPGEALPLAARPEIDRWILSCLNTLVQKVTNELDGYDPTRAGRLIDTFVNDDLSNWFVRLNRKRFWGKEMSDDKRSAYDTLYTCLMTVAKLLAPFAPFYADQLYRDLGGQKDSVHLDAWPKADSALIDADLEARMEMAQKITSMVLALRRKVNIKVRQPLQSIMVPATEEQRRHIEAVKDLIMSEVNVKELKFVEGAGILVKKVKCNFRTMGKKFGKQMKSVAAAVDALTQEQIAQLESNGTIGITVDGNELTVEAVDVDIISEDIPGWLVANEGALTVALEVELNDQLRQEGMAREIINRIQNMRKDSGLEITDRINITLAPNASVEAAVESFGDYVKTQVLADSITIAENNGTEVEFDDFKLNIQITKS